MIYRALRTRSHGLPRTLFRRRAAPSRGLTTTHAPQNVLNLDADWHDPSFDASHYPLRPNSAPYMHPRGPTRAMLDLRRKQHREDPDRIKTYPSTLPSARSKCKHPMEAVHGHQMSVLDPSGARTKLFDKRNNEGVKVGDILLVRTSGGEPFSGVCLNIRRRGVDTGILLRDQVTRVGVEMWFKVFSPNVEGVEVVQRRVKRARRARLYYMRKPKHDLGSVANVVQQYIRQRQALRSGKEVGGRDANSYKRKQAKHKKK